MMKKILVLFTLLISISLNAQFNTGSIYFTGATNMGAGIERNDGVPNILFSLHPEAGYFIKNKLGVGVGVNVDLRIPRSEERR